MSYFPNPFTGIQPIHTTPADGAATYISSTIITMSGLNITVDDTKCYVSMIMYKPSGGTWQQPLVNGVNGVSISASNNVLTVSGAGTPFASGDTYFVAIVSFTKAYDSVSEAQRTKRTNPDFMHFETDPYFVNVTNIADTTTHYAYIDRRSFKNAFLQFTFGGGDTITVKVGASGETDVAPTSATYVDTSTDILGASSITTDTGIFIDSQMVAPYLRIEYTSNNSSHDGDLKVTLFQIY